ncbi:MAG: hypothetical protein JW717_10110 [Marinilabiliaceae bacterium]|nr:hypothetical protein [Marinilabiliaceae bacterium]
MKKSIQISKLFLIVGLIATMFISCDKDDDDSVGSIIGKWNVTSTTIESVEINNVDVMDYLIDSMGLNQIAADLLYTTMANSMKMTGSVAMMENGTYTSNFDGEVDNGTWEMNSAGNLLILDKGTDDEMEMDIISLTSGQLILSINQYDEEDIDEDGDYESFNITMSITFAKE